MKYKVSAFFLSIALCLSCVCVCAVPARASAAAVWKGITTAIEVFQFLKSSCEYLDVSFDVTSFKDLDKFKTRVALIVKFKEPTPSITGSCNKTSLKRFLELWSIQDFDTITEEFGQDVSSYCNTNSSVFFDYYKEVMYFFDSPDDFVNCIFEQSGYDVDDKGNVQIPIEDFKQELEKQNNTIYPKNRSMLKYSWRDLSPNQDNVNLNCFARGIFTDGKSVVGTTLEEGIYIQVYMRRNGYMYYAPYQYKLYFEKESLGGHSPVYQYTWYLEPIYYERLDGVSLDTFKAVGAQFSDYVDSNGKVTSCDMSKYVSLGLNSYNNYWGFELKGYTTLSGCQKNLDSDVVKRYNSKNGAWSTSCCLNADGANFSSLHDSERKYLLRSDDISDKYMFGKWSASDNGTSSAKFGITHFFCHNSYSDACFTSNSINTHDTGIRNGMKDSNVCTCTEGNTCDFGFLISSEQFTTTYQFDTTRLPVNSTVTISGDSVYDYSITDNSTGETSTIYNYVTNNYSYPENSGGNTSGGNGGGTVGGNITVGGQVDVGGKVDINVNVNGNGGGNGNVGDYIDVNSSDVDSNVADYIGLVPKLSKNFIDYMKDFFSWLPKEVYGIFLAGLIFLVVRLVLHRR